MNNTKLIWTGAATLGGCVVSYIVYKVLKKKKNTKPEEVIVRDEVEVEPEIEVDEANAKAEWNRQKPDISEIMASKGEDGDDPFADEIDIPIEPWPEDPFEDDSSDVEEATGIHEIPRHVFMDETSDRTQIELEYYADGFLVDAIGREVDPRKLLGADILKKLDTGAVDSIYVRDEDNRKDYFVKVLEAKWDEEYTPGDFADEKS